jgi:hypothetical protein
MEIQLPLTPENRQQLAVPTLREVLRRDTPGFYTEYTEDALLHTQERTRIYPGIVLARVQADQFDLKDAGFTEEQVKFIQGTNINNHVLTTIGKDGYTLKAYSYIHPNGHKTTWMEALWTEGKFDKTVMELRGEIEETLREQKEIEKRHADAIQKYQKRTKEMNPLETGFEYWPE